MRAVVRESVDDLITGDDRTALTTFRNTINASVGVRLAPENQALPETNNNINKGSQDPG